MHMHMPTDRVEPAEVLLLPHVELELERLARPREEGRQAHDRRLQGARQWRGPHRARGGHQLYRAREGTRSSRCLGVERRAESELQRERLLVPLLV